MKECRRFFLTNEPDGYNTASVTSSYELHKNVSEGTPSITAEIYIKGDGENAKVLGLNYHRYTPSKIILGGEEINSDDIMAQNNKEAIESATRLRDELSLFLSKIIQLNELADDIVYDHANKPLT